MGQTQSKRIKLYGMLQFLICSVAYFDGNTREPYTENLKQPCTAEQTVPQE